MPRVLKNSRKTKKRKSKKKIVKGRGINDFLRKTKIISSLLPMAGPKAKIAAIPISLIGYGKTQKGRHYIAQKGGFGFSMVI